MNWRAMWRKLTSPYYSMDYSTKQSVGFQFYDCKLECTCTICGAKEIILGEYLTKDKTPNWAGQQAMNNFAIQHEHKKP